MDENLALLFGFLLSDGSVYYDKTKRTYCVQFTNKSTRLRGIFKDLMEKCFGVEKFYEIECSNAVSVRVFSAKIARELFENSLTFRTLPCDSFPKCNKRSCFTCKPLEFDLVNYPPCRIPQEILNSKILAKAFLKGFASGDGSATVSERYSTYVIEITCYHPFLRKQISECLSKLDIPSRSNKRSVFVSGIHNYGKFLKDVGFVQ
jgi:DNA-binding transcriptional regulator WhiA